MYAGRAACCPLVSHGEYADGTDRQTVTLCFPIYAADIKNKRMRKRRTVKRETSQKGRSVRCSLVKIMQLYLLNCMNNNQARCRGLALISDNSLALDTAVIDMLSNAAVYRSHRSTVGLFVCLSVCNCISMHQRPRYHTVTQKSRTTVFQTVPNISRHSL